MLRPIFIARAFCGTVGIIGSEAPRVLWIVRVARKLKPKRINENDWLHTRWLDDRLLGVNQSNRTLLTKFYSSFLVAREDLVIYKCRKLNGPPGQNSKSCRLTRKSPQPRALACAMLNSQSLVLGCLPQ